MKKTTTFQLAGTERTKITETILDEKGRLIKESFFGTFQGKDEYSYKYDGELMIEQAHDLEGQITKTIYNYDSEGKAVSHQIYMGNELYQETRFSYTPNVVIQEVFEDGEPQGKIVETTTGQLKRTEHISSDGIILKIIEKEETENGVVETEQEIEENGEVYFEEITTYNKSGKVLEFKVETAEDPVHVKQTFFYENDLLVKRVNFHRGLDFEDTETNYKYDSNNDVIEIMTTSEDGKELEYQEFLYNEHGDVIEQKGDLMPTSYAGFEFQQASHYEYLIEEI